MAVAIERGGEPAPSGLAASEATDLVVHVGGNGRVTTTERDAAGGAVPEAAPLPSPRDGDHLLEWLADAVGVADQEAPGGAVVLVVRRDPAGTGLLVAARRLDEPAAPVPSGRRPRPAALRRLVGFKRKRAFLIDPVCVLAFELRSGLVQAVLDGAETYVVDLSIRELAERLAGLGFFRVHRDVLVNMKRVKEIEKLGQGRVRVVLDTPDALGFAVSRPASARLRRMLRF